MHLGPPIHPPPEPGPGQLVYRLYFFNGGNNIHSSHEFFASSDGDAIKEAERVRKGRTAELWQRARMVKVWR